MGVTRRQFLTEAASAIAGTGLTWTIGKAGTSRVFIVRGAAKKVLILGAGMAGLVAGYELTQLGHDVTILEARTRPGGRVHTLREPFSDGLYAEAGAARIPDQHDLTLKYVHLMGLPLEPMYPSRLSALRFDGGRREVPIETFTEGLGQVLGPDLGGNPDRWSKIKGGTDLLPKALAAKLGNKIHYGAAVVRIEQDAKSARVVFTEKSTKQIFSADRILTTIPFSILKDIELPETLSDRKKSIIKNIRYDAVSRVYLQTKNRAWEEKGLNGFALTDDVIEVWQPTWSQPGSRGILMTYARAGGQAERIERMSEQERIGSTVSLLDSMFAGSVRENFERGTSKCWSQDEWSRGAWAFVGPRDLISAQQPEGRIHFAGEQMSPFFSWMQGAISEGLRAVKEIDEAPATLAAAA
ncbi:MAG TPA: FAD-dependent oxidoreductase [Pyrinomonadaceae bacterium]|nr:FAD-dependent oxidoreductase [Pyrinomonadaceae bacterium]